MTARLHRLARTPRRTWLCGATFLPGVLQFRRRDPTTRAARATGQMKKLLNQGLSYQDP